MGAERLSLSLPQSLSFSDEPDRSKPAKTAASLFRPRTRSTSPPRRKVYDWEEFCRIDEVDEDNLDENDGAASAKPRRWRLKEFLYRSISEGRGRAREKEMERERLVQAGIRAEKKKQPSSKKVVGYNSKQFGGRSPTISKKLNPFSISKETPTPPRSMAPTASKVQRCAAVSAHERYYSANRAQAAEMKKKTFLPYRQGLLAWLGPFQNTNSSNHHSPLPTC